MIESNSVEVGSGELVSDAATGRSPVHMRALIGRLAIAVDCPRAVALATLVAVALVIRVWALGASGYSEDEINKLRAVEAYDHGEFEANAEHPMLMKLAIWGSTRLADQWNARPALRAIVAPSPEAALRLPNAAAGAGTTVVVFLLAEALFDGTVAFWAALFWAIDVNAAAINRIGKEDTFLALFLLLASYLYERGKKLAYVDVVSRDRWYSASGAAFGLMLASKYMPHYFGLHTVFNFAADSGSADDTPDKRASFFIAIAVFFVAANFALLLPSTWTYIVGYVRGDTLRHSGYFYAHRDYVNTFGATPWGVPATFYAAFFLTKVSLAVLAAAAVGCLWAGRHWRDRGATFLRVFLVFTLVPYSFVAGKFLRYMLPVLAVLDIAAGVGMAVVLARVSRLGRPAARALASCAIVTIAVLAPLSQHVASVPYFGLARNALGTRLFPPGWLFPDDEFYDAGVREATQAIARVAPPGAVVCSDATAVVSEYLSRAGRSDLRSCSVAHDGLPGGADTWVIAQDGHTYFENAGVFDTLRRRQRPWLEVSVGGAVAAQVFHLPGSLEQVVRAELR